MGSRRTNVMIHVRQLLLRVRNSQNNEQNRNISEIMKIIINKNENKIIIN